jgi:hypothetical protein
MDDLLALAGVDLVDIRKEREGVLLLQGRLPGIRLRDDLQIVRRKKLLRPGAGLSPGPMVAPVHAGHDTPPLLREA